MQLLQCGDMSDHFGDILEPSDLHVLLQRVVDVDPNNQILLHRAQFALSRLMREFDRRGRASRA
jgi:hypothetical protein